MINLVNTHKSYFDCFEDCLTSIIHYYKKDYMYIFAKSWRANMYSTYVKNPITELLLFSDICNIADEYCGLKSDIRNFYKYEYLEAYLIECIKGDKPIIISVDMFDLPWSEYYQKVHARHFMIIFNYIDNHIFQVFDVTKQIDCATLDLRNAFDGKTCTVVLSEIDGFRELKVEDIIDVSKSLLQKDVEEDKGYDALYYIVDHYFKEDNNLFDLPIEAVEAEPFIARIVYFARQRLAFSEFLKHIETKTGNMNYQSLITGLGDLGAKWYTLRNKLMKIRIKGCFEEKKEDLRTQWIRLIEKEKVLYENFISLNNENLVAQKTAINLQYLNPQIINISGMFDSNAFNSNRWNNESGFDSNGYYYVLDQEEMYYDEAYCEFKFYINQQLDNISCNNQVIPVMLKDVKAVMVIGSCENGDYSEELCFTYENNEEFVSLIFPDWWECDRFGEKVVKKLSCCRLIGNQIDTMGEVYICSQVLTLETGEGMLQSIRLPDCSNMHIFGLIAYI